ncbi:hypothetical protein GCM10022214_20650 [Actinomadura miaoliensis]|uniref:VCBS repeat-containing protein n=1 Tax=Actinomadura miaoliensis TaxID=430685 RepID=A0ABP7VFF0_9ACTN
MRFGRLTAVVAALGAVAAFGTGTAGAAPRAAAECSPHGPDFNGDRCADVAIADPDATVSGKARAGRINIVYGGAATAASLTQGQPGVGDAPEADDGFGTAVRAADLDGDGHADLVVGVPSESVAGGDDAGVIQVIYGSAAGLGGGRPGLVLRQGAGGIGGTPEPGDRFGAAIAVNRTTVADGAAPAVAFGSPGEDVGDVADAGSAGVVTFDRRTGAVAATATITQNSTGIGGAAEAGDRFGAAVELFQGPGGFGCAVSGVRGLTLVAGAPGEDLGDRRDAGMLHLARDLATDTPLSQDTPGVDGSAETGDQFGAALALSSYCEHDGPSHVRLAVGVPAEDVGAAADAGMAHLFATDDDELPLPQRWSATQDAPDVADTAEAGDRFGAVLAVGGPWRDGFGEPVVAGVPGEDVGSAADAGAMHVFGDAAGTPGNGDVHLTQSAAGAVPQPGDRFGAALTSRYDHLLSGAPDDATYDRGVVHGIAWPTVFGTPTPGPLFVPGRDGVPADAVRFGAGLA